MSIITVPKPSVIPNFPFLYKSFADLPIYDHRYMPRWDGIVRRVFYRITGVPMLVRTQLTDLSLSGMGLNVCLGTRIGDRLSMKVYLSRNACFEAEGTVLWKRLSGDYRYCAGVQFERLPQDTQELILEYSFQIPRRIVQENFTGTETKRKGRDDDQ